MNEMMNEMIEQTNERTSVSLRAVATEAGAEVTRLEQEQQEVTTKLADPSSVFDAQLVVRLRQRADELPLFLNASRLRHATLRIAMHEALSLEFKAQLPELHAALEAEKPKRDAAIAAYDARVRAWQAARESSNVSRMDANETRGVVRQLESEAHAMGGAVVRRRPQAA
jgi:hypothetical protein